MPLHGKMRARFLGLCVALALLVGAVEASAQSRDATSPRSNGIDPTLLAKAKAGDADAEYRIAISYANHGNLKESHRWHLMAAQHGNVRAMCIVAAYYQLGRNVPQDYGQALKWYRKAADPRRSRRVTQ